MTKEKNNNTCHRYGGAGSLRNNEGKYGSCPNCKGSAELFGAKIEVSGSNYKQVFLVIAGLVILVWVLAELSSILTN